MMHQCVSISDEALALQILEVKGPHFLTMRTQKATGVLPEQKRGRKSRGVPKEAVQPIHQTLCESIDRYLEYYEKVRLIRENDKDDRLKWCHELNRQQVENSYIESQQAFEKDSARINQLELPMDDDEEIVKVRNLQKELEDQRKRKREQEEAELVQRRNNLIKKRQRIMMEAGGDDESSTGDGSSSD